MIKNTKNSTLDNYKGLIKDLDVKLKKALARIRELEKKLRKLEIKNAESSATYDTLTSQQEQDFIPDLEHILRNIVISGDSLSKSDVIKIINDAIEDGLIKTTIHDHTADDKGGDAYASKGSALQ